MGGVLSPLLSQYFVGDIGEMIGLPTVGAFAGTALAASSVGAFKGRAALRNTGTYGLAAATGARIFGASPLGGAAIGAATAGIIGAGRMGYSILTSPTRWHRIFGKGVLGVTAGIGIGMGAAMVASIDYGSLRRSSKYRAATVGILGAGAGLGYLAGKGINKLTGKVTAKIPSIAKAFRGTLSETAMAAGLNVASFAFKHPVLAALGLIAAGGAYSSNMVEKGFQDEYDSVPVQGMGPNYANSAGVGMAIHYGAKSYSRR